MSGDQHRGAGVGRCVRRVDEDNRIDWSWPARDIFTLVRAQLDRYPKAYCFPGERRLQILATAVTKPRHGGTPGRIFIRDGSGMVIIAGVEYFPRTGGYLTSYCSGNSRCTLRVSDDSLSNHRIHPRKCSSQLWMRYLY